MILVGNKADLESERQVLAPRFLLSATFFDVDFVCYRHILLRHLIITGNTLLFHFSLMGLGQHTRRKGFGEDTEGADNICFQVIMADFSLGNQR
jgi:hypothetical protein